MGKKNQDPDPRCSSRIIFPRAWKQLFELKTLKFFDADPDPGIRNLFDPGSGMEKFGSGINIPDQQH
jgi:hypothetical protein